MTLTSTQLQTIQADIAANADLNVHPNTPDGNQAIADLYNQTATPDFWAFKNSVSTDEARDALDWDEILTGSPLSDLKQWSFDTLVSNGDFDPSLENTRNAFVKIFNGASYVNTRTNLLLISTELATRIEALLANDASGTPGGGDGSTQSSSAVRPFFSPINRQQVEAARNL